MPLHDKCALFGISGDPEASWMSYLGLYAQQHRGQQGAGIVSLYDKKHFTHRGRGLVGQVFSPSMLKSLKGRHAIGHTRYSTHGGDEKRNIQPLTASLHQGPLAMAHNGHIVNFPLLKEELMKRGSLFYSTSDTECLIHLLALSSRTSLPEALLRCLPRLQGAYSFVFLTDSLMVAARDPMGFRPLVLGQRKWKHKDSGKEGLSYVVASETCAFDLIGARYIREIAPSEIWCVDLKGHTRSLFLPPAPSLKKCAFEHVYFSRPDSFVFERSVYESRKRMGQILAEESGRPADIVLPVPDSGTASAIGYSQKSHIPYEMGVVRNHYIGRTFIHPSQSIRDFKVKIKLSVQKNMICGKKVVVVDDSLVRGTTSRSLARMLLKAGAKEVHFRVASPPISHPCFYGIDTPEKSELIASHKSVKEIQDYLGVHSLAFLSHQGLMKALKGQEEDSGFCSACFTGKYPTPLYKEASSK